MKHSKGITLVALVITIVVLIILAAIAINLTLGENGILRRAKMAREEHQKQVATEILKVKMTECQLESIAEKGSYPTLAYLAAYLENQKNTNGDIEYVEVASKVVATLDETPYAGWEKIYTKLAKYSFEFEIDSSFKVSVNGEEVGIPSGYMKIPTETLGITENGEHDVTNYAKVNVNVQGNNGNVFANDQSAILSSLTCSANTNGSDIDVQILPIFKDGHDANDIFEYILIVDGEAYKTTTTTSIKILKFTASKNYQLKIVAIDKSGNAHIGELISFDAPALTFARQVLSYPIITSEGVCNIRMIGVPDDSKYYYTFDNTVEVTAGDALPKAAYDGNATTCAGPYNVTNKYLDIDPSARGKTIRITTNANSYKCYYWGNTLARETREAVTTLTIPSTATKFKLYGNETCKFYEITVE